MVSIKTKVLNFVSYEYTKRTGKALKYTKKSISGPVTHYIKTGTEVVGSDGLKSVVIGSRNRISKHVRQIVTYPKGFFGDETSKTIALLGEKCELIFKGSPNETADFFKNLKELAGVFKI